MLQIKNITKRYITGDLQQTACDGISINLRNNEFVSILGPSGSGKTTLLNIIGGLDRYDSGDLIINGVSTKQYKDHDWDAYRNHSIGFVFQSYNLIPHQSILANVELALTIGGIKRQERRQRAKQALEKVGLGDQLHKRPNQMSGGQMQRVAIARALVNNPDILLADEPTGALDTETSVQIMELLREVAKDRLVVMVTHNPELAQEYSTRIIKLRDGKIIDDSNPLEVTPDPARFERSGRSKMTFITSLALSFNNLLTKKTRTLLTSFAGSIGIIGIALILALSTGVNSYIADMQKSTMASYPITINAQTFDVSGMLGMQGGGGNRDENTELNGIYSNNRYLLASQIITQSVAKNDLTAFKQYLDDPSNEIHNFIGENGVIYTYDVTFGVYTHDSKGNIINTDMNPSRVNGSAGGLGGASSATISSASSLRAENFDEMLPGINGEAVSQVTKDSYEVLYGNWPQSYDEVVIVLDRNNAIETGVLCQLGLITVSEYQEIAKRIQNGEIPDELNFSYADICSRTFYMVPACDYFVENENGTFSFTGGSAEGVENLVSEALELKVSGVIRPVEDASNANISANVAYTSALTDYVINYANQSDVIRAQEASETINVLTGMAFSAADDAQKVEDAKAYLSGLGVSDKAVMYSLIIYSGTGRAQTGSPAMDETAMAAALDRWLADSPDEKILISIYEEYVAGATYEDNMKEFGKVSFDAPSSISIYVDSFDDKEGVAQCIRNYNESVDVETQITYTDYIALLTSSITSMVNAISYVLIAFVAVSLVVSCIMIGIITHISVMERTKEIGILRALGASKGNISQVFNAETVIIGLCSGLLGVTISALLTIPINRVIAILVEGVSVKAELPLHHALVLVVLSVVITVIGGLFPAKNAAKKDPVIALRTE